ncbi:MAG: DUF4440 domain-containing protein [Caulobacteraceae bacterium]|jgi:ketosteroid isomerase-like protein
MPALLAAALAVAASTCPVDPTPTLRAADQTLLDAFATGDRAAWDRLMAPDAVYIDENGAIMPRALFLAQQLPLPAGVSGHLDIISYDVRRDGDVAFVIHHDDEHESYHGVQLRAGYITSEAWVCHAGAWKLAQAHTYVDAKDPPAVALPPAELQAYAGRYRAAPDLEWIVEMSGDRLIGHRPGKPPQPLSFELRDVAFIAGQPRDKRIFRRDAQGAVTGFVLRREGEDVVWKRE